MTQDIDSLTLRQKAGQLLTIGIPGPEIDSVTRELLDEITPGGICLFARNIRSPEQTRELTDGLRSLGPIPPFIAVDQEGGLVDRLRRVMSPMPAAGTIKTKEDAALQAELIAGSLLELGIDVDFAPVVDVITGDRGHYSNGLAMRIFGSTAEETSELAKVFIETLQTNGVTGCLKHFPGLGASQVDSHEELPVVEITDNEFADIDLYPYRQLIGQAGIRAVMVAHAAFPASALQETDQNGKLLPSSLSYNFVTRLLRGELRFDGLVITDDLEMGAIVKNYGVGDACKRAILAGADQAAICADPERIREGHKAITDALDRGEISSERLMGSLVRIDRFRSYLKTPLPFDRSRLAGLASRIADFSERSNRS